MTQPNLPAYLQTDTGRNLNENAMLGIGSALPPHIAIRGNSFTLVDASGAKQPAGATLDVLIADMSDVMCKQYYAEKWTPDSNEPPLCWSANGVAPSREAIEPQSPTCGECRHNVRGSAVSAISGAAIKACRDERWLAVLIPSLPSMRFQIRLTPGSFKNWGNYFEKCKGMNLRLNQIITRITFAPQINGVLLFEPTAYADEATIKIRQQGDTEKAFDVLVGRNDRPIQGALPAPAQQGQLAAPAQPASIAPFVPAQPAGFPLTGTANPQPLAPSASASSPSEPQKRRRRTQAEIAAANAAQQPAPAFAAPASAPAAPFRPAPVAEATNPMFAGTAPQVPSAPAQPAGAPFGIQPGVAPNPEIAATLNSLFAPKQ